MPTPLPPMTAEYLTFHAQCRPEQVAVISGDRLVTYREFDRDVRRFTTAMNRLQLPHGSLAAVESKDPYLHWVMILALESLGVCTATFLAQEEHEAIALLESVDIVFWIDPIPKCRLKRDFRVSQGWLDEVAAGRAATQLPADSMFPILSGPDDPIRLIRSSGTTGGQKRMVRTRRMMAGKIQQSVQFKGCVPGTRHLFTMSFAVNYVYSCATACLRVGTTVILDSGGDVARAIAVHRPQALHTIPLGLSRLMRQLPANFEKPGRLAVYSTGSSLGQPLRRHVLARLATEIVDLYGSNETGLITVVDTDGVGTVLPGVQVELVGDEDRLAGDGEIGRLRVRTAIMSHEYVGNPEATTAIFRHGWFHTGDVARMIAPGRLELVGRSDELLNLNGLKISAPVIESDLAEQLSAHGIDVAISSITNAGGMEELCLAFAGSRWPELVRGIAIRLPAGLNDCRLHVRWLDRIPRNAGGKVQRHQLRQHFEDLHEAKETGYQPLT